ncbi:MAG: hypothetical protein ABI584_07330 [Acidobacteriota bacterium]
MIPSLALALTLALASPAAEPEASGAPPAASGARAHLDERVTLNLHEADLGQVLERLATLLGRTLILQPGIEGTVTLEARESRVSDVIAGLETSHALSIRLDGARMYVTKAGEKTRTAPGKPDEEALDRAFLSDGSLSRRPAAEKPNLFDGSFEFREEGSGTSAVWEIGGSLATVTLPGCSVPLPVILLPGDTYDRVPRVVFGPPRGTAALARIVAPGARFRLPECSAPLTLQALGSRDGASKAVPASQTGQFLLTVQILDAGAGGDEVLFAPRIQLVAGAAGTLQSGSHETAAAGVLLDRSFYTSVAVLDAGDTDALVVCSISVTRDVEPGPRQPPVTIRIARADESLRLSYGKPERITVSPTFGRGRSALVLELTLERPAEKRRGR